MTLDVMSGGRLLVGVGAGGASFDAAVLGGPALSPRPPLVVAGNGPRGMRLALRTADGWATNGTAEPPGAGEGGEDWWAGVAAAARRFEEVAEAESRPEPVEGQGFRRVLDMAFGMGSPRSLAQMRDHLGRAASLGFTDVVIAYPRDSDPLRGSEAVLAELGDMLVDGSLEP